MTLDLLIALAAIDFDEPEDVAERIVDAVITALTPEQVGRAFDDAVQLPEPFESWDDKAVAWLYGAVMEWVSKVDLSRSPERTRRRALRRAAKVSPRKAKAGDWLIDYLKGNAAALHRVGVLLDESSREMKRRDPVWLLKQALKHTEDTEAAASMRRALARLEA